MVDTYDIKMIRIYLNRIKEYLKFFKWNAWQRLNRRFLKTYPLIEECARCRDCGRNVHDFHVPDDIWLAVIGSENGVWCYDCFCDRADRLDIKWGLGI